MEQSNDNVIVTLGVVSALDAFLLDLTQLLQVSIPQAVDVLGVMSGLKHEIRKLFWKPDGVILSIHLRQTVWECNALYDDMAPAFFKVSAPEAIDVVPVASAISSASMFHAIYTPGGRFFERPR